MYTICLFLILCPFLTNNPILYSPIEPKPVVTVGRFQVSPTKEIPPLSSLADKSPSTPPALTPVASPDMPTNTSIFSSHDNQTKGQTGLERNEISSLNTTFSQHLHIDVAQAHHFPLNATHDQSQSLGLEQKLLSEAPHDTFCLNEQSQQDSSKTTWTDETKEEEKEEAQHSGNKEPDANDKLQEEQQQRKKKTRRLGSVQSLTGTSEDSGLCVIMDPDGSLGDGIMDSPQCPVPHHNMWMSYTRTNSYMSSDESESEDEEMWDELQELREK